MKIEKIYRRRIIPEECILLKDDIFAGGLKISSVPALGD